MPTLTLAASTYAATPTSTNKTLITTYTDSDSTDSFTLKIAVDGLATPDPFSLSATIASGDATLTTTSNFNDVRKGDAVSAASGIPGGTTVAAITHVTGKDTKTLELSANATATATQSTTFTPDAPTGDLFLLQGSIKPVATTTPAKDSFVLEVTAYAFNGKDEAPGEPSPTDAAIAGTIKAQAHWIDYETNVERT